MPQRDPEVMAKVFSRLDAGDTQGEISRDTGIPQPTISRWLKQRRLNSAPDSAVQSSVDDSAVQPRLPDTSSPTVQGYALDSADTLANHETRLQVLESFVATLQAQALHASVPHITVQPSVSALDSAEAVQTWDDPEDDKPERWNLWVSRGIKRRIEAHAKAAGIAPSQLVQRLLMAALNGQGVPHA